MCALKFESSYRLIASAPYPYLLDKKKQKDKQEIFFFFNSANVTLKFGGIYVTEKILIKKRWVQQN